MVSRITLPVILSFHEPLCCSGQLKEIAPGCLQSIAQQPQYQHSSGCRIIGGLPCRDWESIRPPGMHSRRYYIRRRIRIENDGRFGVVMLGKALIFI